MKSFKVSTVLCSFVFTLAVLAARPCFAFGGSQRENQGKAEAVLFSNGSSIDDQVKDLTEKLNLTDAQQFKIRSILEDQQRAVEDQMKVPYLSPQDNLSTAGRIQVKAVAKIRELLTREQKKKFDQMEKERRDRLAQESNKDESSQ